MFERRPKLELKIVGQIDPEKFKKFQKAEKINHTEIRKRAFNELEKARKRIC